MSVLFHPTCGFLFKEAELLPEECPTHLHTQDTVARDAASRKAKTVRRASKGRSSADPDLSSPLKELEAALEIDKNVGSSRDQSLLLTAASPLIV
jgi:hypothetical protein